MYSESRTSDCDGLNIETKAILLRTFANVRRMKTPSRPLTLQHIVTSKKLKITCQQKAERIPLRDVLIRGLLLCLLNTP